MAFKLIFIVTINYLFIVSSQHQISAPVNNHQSSPFALNKSLIGCQKGDTIRVINMLKRYLLRFGYLSYSPSNQLKANKDDVDNISDDNYFDEVTEAAVKAYQLNHGLKPTGAMDNETLESMSEPRCGVPDTVPSDNNKTHCHGNMCIQYGSHYAFFGEKYKWPPSKGHLTYGFGAHYPAIAIPPVTRAFDKWAAVSHFTFSQSQEFGKADIKISFRRREHGDGLPFDGPGGVIAHAFAPTDGRVHFDGEENWSKDPQPGMVDLTTTSLHEIGHVLGLKHSLDQKAIMWPKIPEGASKDLSPDDILGIKTLYGDP